MSIGVCVQVALASAKGTPRVESIVVESQFRRSLLCESEIAGAATQEFVKLVTAEPRWPREDKVAGGIGSVPLLRNWRARQEKWVVRFSCTVC